LLLDRIAVSDKEKKADNAKKTSKGNIRRKIGIVGGWF
jgi:hypothetical protein